MQWTHSLGSATIRGYFGLKGKKEHDMQVSTLQAIVLMAFNKDYTCPGGELGNPILFTDLQEYLLIPDNNNDVLKKALHSLSCGQYKVLKRMNNTTTSTSIVTNDVDENKVKKDKLISDKGAIKTTDVFSFNEQFR